MALFGKLFEKKYCAFCGKEIKLLGNRKLEDGNMCKVCAAELSPWFSERRHSTVEEIRGQLAYREANREKLKDFHVTRTLGDNMKILLDEDARLFAVTSSRNLQEDNPDILAFQDVTGCNLDIQEDREEIMREDKDGNEISYSPKRFKNRYDFYITIHVNHPYFSEINFRLNGSTVEYEEQQRNGWNALLDGLTSKKGVEYQRYQQMGEEIVQILTEVRTQAREDAKPKSAVSCPLCGATTIPDENGCCEFCGGALQ